MHNIINPVFKGRAVLAIQLWQGRKICKVEARNKSHVAHLGIIPYSHLKVLSCFLAFIYLDGRNCAIGIQPPHSYARTVFLGITVDFIAGPLDMDIS